MFDPVFLMKATHFKYDSPNLLNIYGKQEQVLPSTPPGLLSSYFSQKTIIIYSGEEELELQKQELHSTYFFRGRPSNTHSAFCALSSCLTHFLESAGQSVHSKMQTVSLPSLGVTSYLWTAILKSIAFLNPRVVPLRLNNAFWNVSLHTIQSNTTAIGNKRGTKRYFLITRELNQILPFKNNTKIYDYV